MSNKETIEKLWDQKDQINFIQDQDSQNEILECLR